MTENIWSYLTYQSTLDVETKIASPEGWYTNINNRPTSFQSYLFLADIFSTKYQFIKIGKVIDYRAKHPELKPWRSGYLCFHSLNFPFEAKNIELIVALKQLLQVPPADMLVPHVTNYNGTTKEASDDMDRYFKQYDGHVTIKGVDFVILNRRDMPYVNQFLIKTNTNWVDNQRETWKHIQPSLISDDM